MTTRSALILAAAIATGPVAASDALPPQTILAGAEWVLAAIDGAPPATRAPTLNVATDGKLSGFSGCNRYFGQGRFERPGAIAVSGLGQTRMACDPAAMALETAFTRTLQGATGWSLSGGALTLTGGGGTLVFRRG